MLEDSVRESNGIVHLTSTDIEMIHNIYDVIDQFQALKLWMTVSPKPVKDISAEDHIRSFLLDFVPASKLMENFLLCFELNEKDQIHFHFFCNFTSRRDKITFQKKYINKWYFTNIIKPIWSKAPKHGCKYLYKQYDYMFDYLDGFVPLLHKGNIDDYKHPLLMFLE